MNKILVTGCMVLAAFAAVAMPNKKELARAKRLVEADTSADLTALRAGKLTAKEVANNHMALAAKAESDAERYLLLQGAFKLYSRDADYDAAAEALTVMNRDIKDLPPKVTIEIINKEMRRVASEKAPKVYAIYQAAQRTLQRQNVEGNGRDAPGSEAKKTYGGYTWSYRVRNGEATLVAEKDGKYSCAVSPTPTGKVSIPPTLNYVKVTRIGREAFRNCKELISVTIPEGVTHIDYNAFSYCGLKSMTLPSSLKVVGWAAFGKCAGLTSVEIPEGVTSIDNDAFNGCSGLKSVVIPNSVTRIGERAFLGCRELTSVTIPAKVASIGEGAFGWCSKLKQINLAADNQAFTLVDGVLYKKDLSVLLACPGTMSSVTIPSGVSKIGAYAFRGCNGLKSVTIPEGVTNIAWGAFRECGGLRSVTISESVKVIGPDAFGDCVELASVTMCGECPTANNSIFKRCGKLTSIHVPANAKSWAGMKDWLGIPLVFDAK